MKQLCLVVLTIVSTAGCASAPGSDSGNAPRAERVADAYVPTGTIIPRKRSERGSAATPVGEVDKQALENERLMNTRQ